MKTDPSGKTSQRRGLLLFRLIQLGIGMATLIAASGCQTGSPGSTSPSANQHSLNPVIPKAAAATPLATTNSPTPYILRAGDILKITFPGSPSLNNVQQIRMDGKISLTLVGEVQAAGMTPVELQNKLMDLYAPQLTSKEVTVEVQNSSFPVYVTGAVLRPGKITSDHPITALEAIMEAGGFDYTKANLKNVTILRQEDNRTRKYTLNLKQTMEGKAGTPFYLKAEDILYVPEKFSWF